MMVNPAFTSLGKVVDAKLLKGCENGGFFPPFSWTNRMVYASSPGRGLEFRRLAKASA
jgi:hypothetical protein